MEIPKGVITGRNVQKVYKLAKEKGFALPAVNVTGNNTINSVLEKELLLIVKSKVAIESQPKELVVLNV